jgi:monoamine oxidase
MKHPDVIILGAGAAGLTAARVLSDAGRSALILEARDRIGGRIHTIRDPAFPAPVEMGAEFIHGRPQVTWDLVREANLPAVDLPFDHWMRRNGRLAHLSNFSAELGKVMGGLAHLGSKDINFAEYLRRRHSSRQSEEARRFAINFVEGFDAADPERISAKSLAEEQRGIGDLDQETQFRLIGGYGELVEYLHKSLDRKRIQVRLNTVVKVISWRRSHVEVLTEGKNGSEPFRAARVLITVPVGVLQAPPESAGSLRFSPDIPDKRRAATQLGSGPIVKAVLKFHRAFWEDDAVARAARSGKNLRDVVFLHDPNASFPTWWTARPLRLPILTAWAGGPKALAMAGFSQKAIEKAAVQSLSQIFGQRTSKIAGLLEKVHAYDWATDPLARGAYSYVTVGGSRARAELAKPIDATLFFAGEATDTSGQASTVAGALISGKRAGEELLSLMRRSRN